MGGLDRRPCPTDRVVPGIGNRIARDDDARERRRNRRGGDRHEHPRPTTPEAAHQVALVRATQLVAKHLELRCHVMGAVHAGSCSEQARRNKIGAAIRVAARAGGGALERARARKPVRIAHYRGPHHEPSDATWQTAVMLGILLIVFIMGGGLLAQRNVTGTFRRWSESPSASGRTGAEVARAILDRNGLMDVPVEAVPGELSDHYDPRKRVVRLSEPVYGARTVSAVAVAAHEVGHAIQHKEAYAPLAVRSTLFPVAAFGGSIFTPMLIGGFVLFYLGNATGATYVILAALALFAFNVLFQLVTLPVEFDASRRAKSQLQSLTLVPAGGQEAEGTVKVLNAAALTYVVAALASVATLVYYAWMFFGRD